MRTIMKYVHLSLFVSRYTLQLMNLASRTDLGVMFDDTILAVDY